MVPFDKRVLHEVFVPAGEEGGAVAGPMVTAEMTRPPTATRNPVGRVLEVLGRIDRPRRRPQGRSSPSTSCPTRSRRTSRRRRRRVAAPRGPAETRRADGLPRLAHGHDRPRDGARPRRRGRDRAARPTAASASRCTSPTSPTTCARGRALDQEAYLRGTSVYFPDPVVPMLPHSLSSDVCSLVEGQDRLTQTVVIDLDARGPRARRTAFHDGVIRSAAQLSYQQAQAIVDGDAAPASASRRSSRRSSRWTSSRSSMRERRFERGLARLRPARAQARPRRAGRDDGHRAPRAARQHAARRGVHAGRERGGGGGAAPRRRGGPLPRPRAARPRAGRGVRGARRLARLPRAGQARDDPSGGLPEDPDARSRAGPRRSSSRTCCCAR